MTQSGSNLKNLWDTVLREHAQISFERLTEADVMQIDGDAERFLTLLQERYGYTPEQAQEAMNTFLNRYNTFDNSRAGAAAATGHNQAFSEVF